MSEIVQSASLMLLVTLWYVLVVLLGRVDGLGMYVIMYVTILGSLLKVCMQNSRLLILWRHFYLFCKLRLTLTESNCNLEVQLDLCENLWM